jgi:hypothetical protein
MLQEVGFDVPQLDFTAETLLPGIFVGACVLAGGLFAKRFLRHYRKNIPWRFFSNYYAASTPIIALLFVFSNHLPAPNPLQTALILSIGFTQLPLLPIHAMAAMLLIPDLSPWLLVPFATLFGYFLGRASVFVLHWIAWSAEPSSLNLNSQD